MSVGLIVTLVFLALAYWVMLKLAFGKRSPRLGYRPPRTPPRPKPMPPSPGMAGLSPHERRRLYRRLGIDPVSLRQSGRLVHLRYPPEAYEQPRR